MWHYANWLLWGREEDRIAWKGLTGQIGKDEIIKEKCSVSGKKNGKANVVAMNGHENTFDNQRKQGEANGSTNAVVMNNHPNTQAGRAAGGKRTNSQRWQCLDTGFVTNPGNLTKYQKARGIETALRKRIS